MLNVLIREVFIAAFLVVILHGCVSQGTLFDREAILQKPYKRWTEDECRIVMKDYASTNTLDRAAPLNIVVIPCTPKFLLAYNCLKWKKHLCSFDEFSENTDRQSRNCFGGAFDGGSGMFISGKGGYIRNISQLDSLLIVVDIQNATDVQKLVASGLGALMASSAYQGLFPDITGMENKIMFRAGNTVLAKPVYVRGSDMPYLMKEQQYAAMFYLDRTIKEYLREHESIDLYFEISDHAVVVPVRFAI
jgi:hypothetical protein